MIKASTSTATNALPSANAAPTCPIGCKAGEQLGRYVVLGELGSGGMGIVYAGYDPDLQRKVAIKMLHATGADLAAEDSDAVADGLLMREARAMAALSHPNIMPIFDVGSYGHRVFITMPHVAGADLHVWLKAGKRSWRSVLDVLLAAGRGLAAAHRAGMVHRDFKPSNVFVAADGSVYVIDSECRTPARSTVHHPKSCGARRPIRVDAHAQPRA